MRAGMNAADAKRGMLALAGRPVGPRSVYALRQDYVAGALELDEFEARISDALAREDAARRQSAVWDCDRIGHLFTFGEPACRYCGEAA